MKKVLLVSAFAVLALASCKKDYECDCGAFGTTTYNDLSNDDADVAQAACEDNTAGICTFKEK